MFLLSSPIKACLLSVSLVASSSLKGRVTVDTDPKNLELPLNLTKSTPLINETNSSAEPVHDDVAWPNNAASPSLELLPLNASLASPELGAPSIHCNGKAYGKNLKVASCYEALSKMPRGTKALDFGERGYGHWDGVLPYRILSSDGLCGIDIGHKANVLSDNISPWDLRQSAELVIQICVEQKPNEGGVVSNIGKHGNLLVRVVRNKHTVVCGPPHSGPPIVDCKALTDSMPTDGAKDLFGQKNDTDPNITVKLPATYTRYRERCQVFINTMVPGAGKDSWDRYKVWATATAIEYMCVHNGRNGIASELGEGKKLMLAIKDLAAPPDSLLAVSR